MKVDTKLSTEVDITNICFVAGVVECKQILANAIDFYFMLIPVIFQSQQRN